MYFPSHELFLVQSFLCIDQAAHLIKDISQTATFTTLYILDLSRVPLPLNIRSQRHHSATMLCSCMNCLQHFGNDSFQLESGGYSMHNDLLPSLGATINHTIKLRKHIVSPYDPRYRYTDSSVSLYSHNYILNKQHVYFLLTNHFSGYGRNS